MRDSLKPGLIEAQTVEPEELPRLLGDLEEIRATALARLTAPVIAPADDELLEVPEASARLRVSPDYLYRHHGRFPFTRRIGRKLLFSAKGIEKHIAKSRQ